jgi:hypothetical protein
MPPPKVAVLWLTVLRFSVTVPRLKMPPPPLRAHGTGNRFGAAAGLSQNLTRFKPEAILTPSLSQKETQEC